MSLVQPAPTRNFQNSQFFVCRPPATDVAIWVPVTMARWCGCGGAASRQPQQWSAFSAFTKQFPGISQRHDEICHHFRSIEPIF